MSERLKEIRDVLIQARATTDYDIASPRAFDSLVTLVIALVDELYIQSELAKLPPATPLSPKVKE